MMILPPVFRLNTKKRPVRTESIMRFEDYMPASGSFANGFCGSDLSDGRPVFFTTVNDNITLQFSNGRNGDDISEIKCRKNDVLRFDNKTPYPGQGVEKMFDSKRDFSLYADVQNVGQISRFDTGSYNFDTANLRKTEYLKRKATGENIIISTIYELQSRSFQEIYSDDDTHIAVAQNNVYVRTDCYSDGGLGGYFFRRDDILKAKLNTNFVQNLGQLTDFEPSKENPDKYERCIVIFKDALSDDEPIANVKVRPAKSFREVPEFSELDVESSIEIESRR